MSTSTSTYKESTRIIPHLIHPLPRRTGPNIGGSLRMGLQYDSRNVVIKPLLINPFLALDNIKDIDIKLTPIP